MSRLLLKLIVISNAHSLSKSRQIVLGIGAATAPKERIQKSSISRILSLILLRIKRLNSSVLGADSPARIGRVVVAPNTAPIDQTTGILMKTKLTSRSMKLPSQKNLQPKTTACLTWTKIPAASWNPARAVTGILYIHHHRSATRPARQLPSPAPKITNNFTGVTWFIIDGLR